MNRHLIPKIIVLALALGAILLVWSRSEASSSEDTCKESMEVSEDACGSTEKINWEALPNQFFSSF